MHAFAASSLLPSLGSARNLGIRAPVVPPGSVKCKATNPSTRTVASDISLESAECKRVFYLKSVDVNWEAGLIPTVRSLWTSGIMRRIAELSNFGGVYIAARKNST